MAGRYTDDWEELAAVDPFWAVLSAPDRKGGRWELDAFLATGEDDVAAVLAVANELARPIGRHRVLDFGCGVGRLARPFASEFEQYVGVDVSRRMTARARDLHDDLQGCSFHSSGDLDLFDDGSFDLVYSNLVLQHQPSRESVERLLAELLRVARSDGLVAFQLPAALARRRRVQPRRRAYAMLRRLGAQPAFLQRRLGLHPIRVLAVPEADVRRRIQALGGEVVRVTSEEAAGISSRRYYATAAPR